MQKKVISLMMTLVLAFMGVARAEVVTIGEGSSSNVYIPTRSYYNYSLTQQLYTADEIGSAGSISSIAFYNSGTEVTRDLTLYLVNTDKTVFSDNYDWITVSASDQVFSGNVTLTSGAWATITFDTPFAYDGSSNLAVVVDDNTGNYVNGSDFLADNTTTSQALYIYSDGVNYDPFNPSNYSGTQPFMKNQIQLGLDDSATGSSLVLYEGEEMLESIDLGTRPIGAWMEPYPLQLKSIGMSATVTHLDFTPEDGLFTVENITLPVQIANNEAVDFAINTNGTAAGLIERQFVAIYEEGGRTAAIWPITVEFYTPAVPDVVELPCEEATSFPFVEVPATAHGTTLHNDYHIPPTDIEDGVDAVYKLVFDQDVMLSAEVSQGENGKVALYTEDFYGRPGPMVDNAYTGAMGIEPSQGGELTVFDGTVTNAYVPVEGIYADYYQKCEYVMPAGNLTEMSGMDINSMKFYLSQSSTQPWASTWTVFMKEIGTATVNAFQGTGGATIVYEGLLDSTQEEMTVDFTTPYHYNGGNLLIGFYSLVPTTPYTSAYFYGETLTGACVRGRNSSSLDGVTPTQQDFVPKTTFVYGNRTDTPMTPAASGSATIEGLTVTPGTYYLVASSTTPEFEVTINSEALPCPVAISGDARTPIDGAMGLEPSSVELTWQLGEYTTAWRLVFGSTYYPEEGHPQTIITDWSTEPANSYTVHNLWNNTQYFWRIEEKNDNCPEGTASETWGFTTHLNIPHNLTANDDQIFEGETVTLNWNAIQDRTYRYYYIYQDGVKIGETDVNQINQTTYTVNNLTYNMEGYVFNVTAVYDEGESDFSNDVIVKVSGYSNATGINGYAYEQDGTTGIQGALVTINGTDEFGDAHTYTAT
ncbi:MAG: fibronectin type III domain-containing protein, partial [Bacteroidales bacterium]|nr:fibronectin type III domain-containing protein [Bacteroidales bacterium]